jgi:Tol biopolymer transport system component
VSSTSGGRPHVLAQGADSSAVWLRNGRIAYVTQARVRSEVETTKGRALLRGPTRFQAGEGVEFAGLAWAPNGSALACLYGSELRIVTSDGRSSRVLARGVTDGPAWSPDGRVIAFAAAGGLRLVDAAGGPSRLLTRAGETMPAWSPDGRRIAFLHVDENADVSDLYVVDRDGRHVTRLAKDVSSAPSWSPDGERIAFSVGGDYIPTAIETIRVDGTGLSEPASAPAAEDYGDVLSNPQWSPDGRTILYYDDEYFCGSKCDELHLTLMRPDGTDKRRLVDDVLGAAWAPDGNELLGQYAPDESLLTVDVRTGQRRFLAGRAGAWAWQPLPARR